MIVAINEFCITFEYSIKEKEIMKTTGIKAIEGTRHQQMAHAEKARKLLRAIEFQVFELQLLPNGEAMSNNLFRLALKENENLKGRLEELQKRKFNIKRVIFVNA